MILVRVALAFAALLQPGPGNAGSPTQIVALATRAVDHDSVSQARDAWTRRLKSNANDRSALLGLQVLAERQFDFPRATAYYGRLTSPRTPPDSYMAYAALERGKTQFSRGLLLQAESTFVRAAQYARVSGERFAEFDATLGVAMARGRSLGAGVELRMLDSLQRGIPKGPALDAAWRCERASLAARTGERIAAPLATQGIALAQRAGDTRLEARCTWTLAQDYVRQGDMATVAALLTRTENMLQRVHEHAGLSAMLQWHGFMEVSIANYGRAQQLLQRAVREAELSGELSSLAWSLVNLSQISLSVNDLPLAEQRAARAESTFRATRDEWGLATAIGLRGQVALDIGDTAAARRQYLIALGLAERDRLALGIGEAHRALADLAVRAGDWRGARRELAAQRAALERGGATGWEGQDFYYGVVALRQGDLREAERRFRGDQATLDSAQHVRRYLSQAMLAEVVLRQGDTLAAEQRLGEASAQLDAWRQTLGDQQFRQLAFQVRDQFGGRPPAIATLISGIARSGRVEQAFALAERRRARDLRDRLSRAAGLRVATDSTNANTGGAAPVQVSDVQRAIPDDRTALLEYVAGRAGQPTTVFAITRRTVRATVLAPLDSVRDVAARFEALIESGGNVRALATQLGKALLQPAVAGLPPGITSLVVVPDDAMWLVPFQALILADGKWAIERYAMTTVPSAAVSVTLWQRPAPAGPARLLAFGDPRFAGDDDGGAGPVALRAATADEPLPRLPATAREVRAVARFASDAVIRLRDDASAAFLERAPLTSYRVIHFATHAVTDDNGIAHAGLALAPGHGSDGFVSDGDLAALKLNADLVVLSACHTADGTVLGGEGVRGLTAPLLQAGARAVLATEWPVDDARTVPMIVAFYTALADGRTSADALREAALGALRDGAPPREWAAFRLVGNPSVHIPLRQSRGLFGWPWWR